MATLDQANPADSISTPFLRWAGGKRWLLPRLNKILPQGKFRRYVEPFLGGGSLFLGWGHKLASEFVLSDIESGVVETFRSVKEDPERVISILQSWKATKKNYLSVRSTDWNGNPASNAARMIFLNRLAWNGLYRINRSGKFNVPYSGRPIPKDLAAWIRSAAKRLSSVKVRLEVGDFPTYLEGCEDGDIVVLDPPYVSPDIGRTPHRYYNVDQFTWERQKDLARLTSAAVRKGAGAVITPGRRTQSLYSQRYFKTIYIYRQQGIAADADLRGRIREPVVVSKNLLA